MGQILSDLGGELFVLFVSIAQALPALVGYIAIILLAMTIWRFIRRQMTPKTDYTSLKTVTFGDESAVVSDKAASFISIALIFVIWA